MSGVVFDVIDPRTDREPLGWAEFCRAQQAHPTWDYRLMGLEGMASGTPNVLVTARVNGELVAAVVALLTSYRSGMRRTPGRARGLTTVAPRWFEVVNRWLSGFPPWVFAEHLDPGARREVLRGFEKAACRYAGPGCLGVYYRSVRPDELALVTGRGRLVRDVMGYAELDNSFTTMEDWIASLAKKRRYAIRGQVRKIAADPDLTIEFGAARDDLSGDETAAFLDAHRDRHGRAPMDSRGYLHPEYMHELVRRPDVHTLTYRNETGRLIGLATLVDHPITLSYQHWATVRPEDGGKQHLYFDSYPRLVRHMVDNGAKSLNAGRGMLDLKASIGFTARELRAVAVPRPFAG